MINPNDHAAQLARAQAAAQDLPALPRAADNFRLAGLDSALELIAARRSSADREQLRLEAVHGQGSPEANAARERREANERLEALLGNEVLRTEQAISAGAAALESFFVLHGRVFAATGKPPAQALIVQAVHGDGRVESGIYLDDAGYFQLRIGVGSGQLRGAVAGEAVRLRVLTPDLQVVFQGSEPFAVTQGRLTYRDLQLPVAGVKASIDTLAVQAKIDSDPKLKAELAAIVAATPGKPSLSAGTSLRGGEPGAPGGSEPPPGVAPPGGPPADFQAPDEGPPAKAPPAKQPPGKEPPSKEPGGAGRKRPKKPQ